MNAEELTFVFYIYTYCSKLPYAYIQVKLMLTYRRMVQHSANIWHVLYQNLIFYQY